MNGKAYPGGVGKNKKEAKQNAAKNALRGLLERAADSVRLLHLQILITACVNFCIPKHRRPIYGKRLLHVGLLFF